MDDIEIDPRIIRALRKAKILTTSAVLESSLPSLARKTKLSLADVETLVKAVSERVPRPKPITALDLYKNLGGEASILRKLSFGCPILDRYLGGGILSQNLTEISGVSASGKTQVCLQLSLTVQLPYELGGLEGAAVYVSTEDIFPSKRLLQMIPHFQQKHSVTNMSDNVLVTHVADVATLFNFIENKLPVIMKTNNVRLVIIDSIAAIFRVQYAMNEMAKRTEALKTVGARLKKLSLRHNMPVVCVNQVSTAFHHNSHHGVAPCLGQTWSSLVDVRIMLSRSLGLGEVGEVVQLQPENPARELTVIFAPHLPNITLPYIVDASGVHGIQ